MTRTIFRAALGVFVAGLCLLGLAVDPTAPQNQPTTTTSPPPTTSTTAVIVVPATIPEPVETQVATPTSLVRHTTEADDIVVTADAVVVDLPAETTSTTVAPAPACDYLDETGTCGTFPAPPDDPDCRDTQGAQPCWFRGLPDGCTVEQMEADPRHPSCFPLAP